MERTLKIVQARHAIEDALFAYAEAIDRGELEQLRQVLEVCTVTLGDLRLEGGAQVYDHYRRVIIFYDGNEETVEYRRGHCTPRTRHLVSNIRFEFSSAVTSANVSCCVTVYQHLGGENRIIAGGRYLDRFDLSIGGWQMVEREILIDHPGDMQRHTKTGDSDA